MNPYEQRLERRRERLERIASKLQAEGDARYARARQMADAIPFGQPILVGHHSERRDRAFRGRIESNFSKAFEAQKAAAEYAAKAAAVGTGGISSDDPEAVTKLRDELAELEALQGRMKAANAAIRKHAKAGPEAQVAALGALGFDAAKAAKLLSPDFAGRIGFPAYAITNNGANMRRIKARINQLAEVAKTANQPTEVVDCGPYKVVKNYELNRLQLVFPGKPSEAVRSVLKSNGFKWAHTEKAWQRMLSNFSDFHVVSPEGYLRKQLEKEVQS